MERAGRIWEHPHYQELLKELKELEEDRVFCRHDVEHFLSVARLTYIYSLKENAKIDQELIYAAALLHDIGRPLEYKKGIPHHEASGQIASKILPQCGFSEKETEQILDAILWHRGSGGAQTKLGRLLGKADKASRSCFACTARDACKWPREKMNLKVED